MFNDTSKILPHPDAAYDKKLLGVIESLHLPNGGIIRLEDSSSRAARVSGGRVFFHRARAFLESGGRQLSVRRNLLDVVKVGDAVSADVITNRIPGTGTQAGTKEAEYFPNCGANLVALAVYPRSADFEFRPKLPEVIFDGALTSTKEVYIARIISFDDPGPTGVESGLAELIKPSDCPRKSLTNRVSRLSDPGDIKYVVFHRSRMLHLNVPLKDADLRYFFSSKSKCMNGFYCRVQPISNPMAVSIATHEITVGWKSSLHPLAPVRYLPTGKTSTVSSPGQASLLFPCIYSFYNVQFMTRNGWDVELFENIISGRAPKRGQYPIQYAGPSYSFARVSQIYSPSETDDIQAKCSMAMFEVETGPGLGRQCNARAENVTVFGFSLAETDLRRILEQNDPFWTNIMAQGKDTKGPLTASEAWIGWPASRKQPLSSIPHDDRWRILQFLECRGIKLSEFVMAVNGDHPIRPDVPYVPPFLREINLGHVVGTKTEDGVSSGIIKVCGSIFQKWIDWLIT